MGCREAPCGVGAAVADVGLGSCPRVEAARRQRSVHSAGGRLGGAGDATRRAATSGAAAFRARAPRARGPARRFVRVRNRGGRGRAGRGGERLRRATGKKGREKKEGRKRKKRGKKEKGEGKRKNRKKKRRKRKWGKGKEGKEKEGGGARQRRPRPRSATRGVVTRVRATGDGHAAREEKGEREKEGARFAAAGRDASHWMGKDGTRIEFGCRVVRERLWELGFRV